LLHLHTFIMQWCSLAGLIAIAGACGKDNSSRTSAPPAQSVEVGTVEIRPQRVQLTTELPARTSAFRVAEVRARVDGIVQKRLYTEGSDVRDRQPLFQIDPAPFQAALQRARAELAAADASALASSARAPRRRLPRRSCSPSATRG